MSAIVRASGNGASNPHAPAASSNFRDEKGDYIMIACDQAVFLPMMHLSHLEGKKLQFVPIIGYHYNIDLSNKNLFTSDRSVKQKMSAETIRARGYLS